MDQARLKRGDVVTVVFRGDYGKPRPAIVVQSDYLGQIDSIILCPITSDLRDAPLYRLTVEPSENNGLRKRSQIMIDKIAASPQTKCSGVIGRLEVDTLQQLNALLALAIGLLD